MAFADWPLSNGSVNPPGWLYVSPQRLEHGHRLLASTVGFLVLALFLWRWFRAKHPAHEALLLVLSFVFIFISVHMADGMAKKGDAAAVSAPAGFLSAQTLWSFAVALGLVVLAWLWRGLRSSRWDLLLKLSAASLVTVVAQAVLGGLRVLEVSDPFGIAHGCLGQLFYCLLLAIAVVSSPSWARGGLALGEARQHRVVFLSSLLFIAVVVQLLLGAIVRHTQRGGLAATDVLTTAGHLVPPMVPVGVFTIFLHKAWAVVVFILAIVTGLAAARAWRAHRWITVLPRLLLLLPVAQLTLGVFVVHTGKKFWVTNLHVLNGLAILGTAFLVLVTAWRSSPLPPPLAKDRERRHPSS
jgi:heme A synthase